MQGVEESKLEEYDLLECIDKGLQPFGTHVTQTIYWRLLILHGSQREGIITDPAAFAKMLREIFDESSIGIEKSIIREISKVFTLSDKDSETLATAIVAARGQVVLVSSVRTNPLVAKAVARNQGSPN